MVEVDPGSILIDGVDIRLLGLKQLRSQMSIIPQVSLHQAAGTCSKSHMLVCHMWMLKGVNVSLAVHSDACTYVTGECSPQLLPLF
jgi:hypothetical protein